MTTADEANLKPSFCEKAQPLEQLAQNLQFSFNRRRLTCQLYIWNVFRKD